MLVDSFSTQGETNTLADRVAEELVDAILSGKFAAGQLLTEGDVTEWLGVSRTPVREAFRTLHRQRLLDKDSSRSYRVAIWDESDLVEVAELRAALETQNVELAAVRVVPRELDILSSIVMQMQSALARSDHQRLVELDTHFHTALWRLSGNTRLLQSLLDLKPQIRYFLYLTRRIDEHRYAAMHQELVTALEMRDVEQAKRAMREHTMSSVTRAGARLEGSQAEMQASSGE